MPPPAPAPTTATSHRSLDITTPDMVRTGSDSLRFMPRRKTPHLPRRRPARSMVGNKLSSRPHSTIRSTNDYINLMRLSVKPLARAARGLRSMTCTWPVPAAFIVIPRGSTPRSQPMPRCARRAARSLMRKSLERHRHLIPDSWSPMRANTDIRHLGLRIRAAQTPYKNWPVPR